MKQRSTLVERAALVGLMTGTTRRVDAERSMEELEGLAEAAGAQVVLRVLQEKPKPDPATFLGSGKVAMLAQAADEAEVDVIVFDNELSPAQLRELGKRLSRKVVDRTQLILDIFARRARTREGKLQVELAQLKYLLPRLVGMGAELSRLGGGIGTRGPGETKLEADRRRIRERIHGLEEDINVVRRRRSQLRDRRHKEDIPTVALVGYTNAGKTTLFNRLSKANAEASDALFVTLDPLVRQVMLPDRRPLLLSDTVGFIDRLPHTLVAAFRATLEETADADLVLHVIDASSPDHERHAAAVSRVLEEVGATTVPRLEVYNKVDRLSADERRRLREADPSSMQISASTGEGCAALLGAVAARLALDQQRITVKLDLSDPEQVERLGWIYRHGRVHSQTSSGDRVELEADLPRRLVGQATGVATARRARGGRALTGRALAFLLAFAGLMVIAGCAARIVTPVVTAPKHPDFVFPVSAPGSAPALVAGVERGWLFMQAGDFPNAERELTRALKTSPQDVSADTALGYLELARGDAGDAAPIFARALSRDPRYAPALAGRGYALMDLKREGEALTSFEAALKADPSLVDLQGRVDVLRFRATQDLVARASSASEAGRFDDARAAYAQAIAASPESAFLYRDLAAVERRAGQASAAADHLRKAAALDPTDARALASLGEILDEQDDPVAALAAYEKAAGIDASAVPNATMARARDRVALLGLPAPYRAIPGIPQVTRGDLAALLGVRLQTLVARAAERQVVITDVRGHWAQDWIMAVVRGSIMDTLPNYQFQPNAVVRRGDLARTVSRVLSLVEALRPAAAAKWRNARVAVSDLAPTHLSYPAVAVAVASGVMPLEGGAFRLLEPVTGSEAVEVISRLEALAR